MSTGVAKQHTRRRGFTLVEQLVVLGLLAAILAFGGVRMMRTFQENSLVQTVENIKTMIRFIQVKAIEEGVIYKLSKTEDQRHFTVQRMRAGESEFTPVTLAIMQHMELTKSINVGWARDHHMLFYPDGSTSRNKIELQDGTEKRVTIELTNRIGSIEVSDGY